MKRLVLTVAILIGLAAPAWGQSDAGYEAYKRGDYAAAHRIWKPLADQGDASAQYNLGLLYHHGLGVKHQLSEAAKWYGRAAENGDADAQKAIGDLYVEGFWGKKDYAKAATWYRMAAEQGHAEAQRKLGVLFAQGRGVDRNSDAAIKWLRKAVEQGDAEAQKSLRKLEAKRQRRPRQIASGKENFDKGPSAQGGQWETYMAAATKAYQQGNYPEAEKQLGAALKEAEGFGPQDPRLATSLNNLAVLYRAQGKYAEAEPLYKRALIIRQLALGPDHPDVAASLNNLAVLYEAQGKYADAEPFYKRALAILEKALGPEHPNVATGLKNYAALLRKTARGTEAVKLEARAKAIRVKHAEQNPVN